MFDNPFVDQQRFDNSEPNDNEDDVNDEIIPHVPEFGDAFGSNFIVSHDWALSHRHMPRGFNLEVSQTFSSKKKLVNVVKRWHIVHLIEYQVQQSNSTFIQL